MDIEGKVVVVTGASRGLGEGLATRLAEQHAHLGLCARTMPGDPGGALVRSVDVTDADAVAGFAGAVVERFGAIDLWINNAGVLEPVVPLRDAAPAEVARNIGVNVVGVANGTIAYLRHRHDVGGGGALVNITSGAARTPYQGWAAYGAAKAAVDQLTRVVAAEEAGSGVRVLAVAPGVVDTDMQARIRASDERDFPAVGRFRDLADSGSFNRPAWVADRIVDVALGPDAPDDVVVRIPDEPR